MCGLALAGRRSILRGSYGGSFSEGGAKLSMNDGRTGEVSMFALDPRLEQDTLLLGDFPSAACC